MSWASEAISARNSSWSEKLLDSLAVVSTCLKSFIGQNIPKRRRPSGRSCDNYWCYTIKRWVWWVWEHFWVLVAIYCIRFIRVQMQSAGKAARCCKLVALRWRNSLGDDQWKVSSAGPESSAVQTVQEAYDAVLISSVAIEMLGNLIPGFCSAPSLFAPGSWPAPPTISNSFPLSTLTPM